MKLQLRQRTKAAYRVFYGVVAMFCLEISLGTVG